MTPEPVPPAGKRTALLSGFVLGLFLLFVVQILVGLIIETQYRGASSQAYESVRSMQSGVFGKLRGFHYWSSALLILGSFGALAWMVHARWFKDQAKLWFATAALFASCMLFQISGNLLPFDRHGVQTSVIEAGVARQMPVMGPISTRIMLGADQFNESTLSRWHVAHMGFVVIGLFAAALGWNALRSEEKSRTTACAPVGIALIGAIAVAAPLGNPASSADFGSYEAQVSWYTWPLHGSLHLFSKLSPSLGWVGSGVIPALFALIIVTAPWTSRRLPAAAIQAAFYAFCGYFLFAGVAFGGSFAPLTGNRDPQVAEIVEVKMPPVNQRLYDEGRKTFNSEPCAGCHGVDGRKPTEGPSLLGIAKRRGVDPTWYQLFIKDPKRLKPNTTMPAFPEFPDAKTRAIAEFLIHQQS